MVSSLNTTVDLTIDGTSFLSLPSYGKIMVGDKAFEFYNNKNIKDYIQIPWEEIDYVMASVMFKGRWIPRFAIVTKKNGNFTFSSKHNKTLLKAMKKYISDDHMVSSLSFFQVINRGFKSLFKKR